MFGSSFMESEGNVSHNFRFVSGGSGERKRLERERERKRETGERKEETGERGMFSDDARSTLSVGRVTTTVIERKGVR